MADFRVFFEVYCDHRDLHVLTHSCPTRRSSDLRGHRPQRSLAVPQYPGALEQIRVGWNRQRRSTDPVNLLYPFEVDRIIVRANRAAVPPYRSEEHTPELLSLIRSSYAVFCLTKNFICLSRQHSNEHMHHSNP